MIWRHRPPGVPEADAHGRLPARDPRQPLDLVDPLSVTLWLACGAALLVVGTVPGDISVLQALGIAAAITLPAALFASVGALACQLAATHRAAPAIGGACIELALLVRVLADLVGGLGALRYATRSAGPSSCGRSPDSRSSPSRSRSRRPPSSPP